MQLYSKVSSSHFALAILPYPSTTHPKQEAEDAEDAGERRPYAAQWKLSVIVRQNNGRCVAAIK